MMTAPHPASRRAGQVTTAHRRFASGPFAAVFGRLHERDPETAVHCLRVAASARLICRKMGWDRIPATVVSTAALFHDIGKTAVSSRIIQKEGMLTGKEFEAVKQHTEKTREILGRFAWPAPFARVPEIAACHHERWDGSGYPQGLAGRQIPVGARVIAVADWFDALTARRRYRDPLSCGKACKLLAQDRGRLFDPSVVDAFLGRLPAPDLRRAPAAFPLRSGTFIHSGTFAAPPRFLGAPGTFHDSEWRRCR